MMKRALLFLAVILVSMTGMSQTNTKYWVYLTDKNNTPYSISNPSAFLTAKSIQRRTSQGISIKQNDLPVDPAYVQGIQATGVTVLFTSKWMNAVAIYTTDPSKITQVNALPYVSSIKVVQRLKGEKKLSNKMEDLIQGENQLRVSASAYNYGPSYKQINMLGGDQLHNLGYRGQGMVIAVLDAGFSNVNILPAFDSLRNQNRLLGSRDFVTGDTDVFADHSHGCYVLSTMAANLPGQLIGTAPQSSYWLIRTEDANTETLIEEANWVRGAEFADSVGADIINSSLGYTTFDDPSQSHTYGQLNGNTTIISKGADLAASKGILVVNSAGNEGNSSWFYISAPADGDSVLTIGSVDSSEVISNFSSRGPSADGQIKPSVCAMGTGSILASTGGGIFSGNGTSFSSPILAGMSACLWQANRAKNNMQIYDAILRSADRYNNPNNIYGYGVPNFTLANLMLTGIRNLNSGENTSIHVYPNPFTNELNFQLYSKGSEDVFVMLYDIKGEVVFSKKFDASKNSYLYGTFPISQDLQAGMYFLRMQAGNVTSIQKIIRQ